MKLTGNALLADVPFDAGPKSLYIGQLRVDLILYILYIDSFTQRAKYEFDRWLPSVTEGEGAHLYDVLTPYGQNTRTC
jgi:hypothetical protein